MNTEKKLKIEILVKKKNIYKKNSTEPCLLYWLLKLGHSLTNVKKNFKH